METRWLNYHQPLRKSKIASNSTEELQKRAITVHHDVGFVCKALQWLWLWTGDSTVAATRSLHITGSSSNTFSPQTHLHDRNILLLQVHICEQNYQQMSLAHNTPVSLWLLLWLTLITKTCLNLFPSLIIYKDGNLSVLLWSSLIALNMLC